MQRSPSRFSELTQLLLARFRHMTFWQGVSASVLFAATFNSMNKTPNNIKSKLSDIFSSGPKSAGVIFTLVLVWLAAGLIFKDDESYLDAVSTEDNKAKEVLVARIQAEAVNREIKVLGQTRYQRRVLLTALTNGTVVSIPGKEGTMHSEIETIIKLDAREAKAKFQHAKSLEEKHQLELEAFEKLFEKELISSARLADAKAQLQGAKAEKIEAQINLESTMVKPPFEGILQEVFVEQGDYLRVGDKIAEVLDFSPFVITGDVSEKEASFIKQGQGAKAQLIDGSSFEGIVVYKSTQADPQSRSFKIEVEIANPNKEKILSGVSANISIPVTHNSAHKVSSSSLEIDAEGKFGLKLVQGEKAKTVFFQQVEVIKSDGDGVWVSGLPEQAEVIVRGGGFVQAGEQVTVVYEQPKNNTAQAANTAVTPKGEQAGKLESSH